MILPHTDGECWCERCVWQAAHDAANRESVGDPIIWHEKAAASLTAARIRWQEMAVEELATMTDCEPKPFPGGTVNLYQFAWGYQPHYVVARDLAHAEEIIRAEYGWTYEIEKIEKIGDYVLLPKYGEPADD